MGYQATTGNTRHHAANGGSRVPLDEDLASRLVHRLDRERILLRETRLREVIARLEGRRVQLDGLLFLAELFLQRLLHLAHVDGEQTGKDAVVHHVAYQAPQLGVVRNPRHQLVERDGIEDEVRA
jgi:hypothetical protein